MKELTNGNYFPCPHCGEDALEIYNDMLVEMGDGTLIKVEELPMLMCESCGQVTVKDENGDIIKNTVMKKMVEILDNRDKLDLEGLMKFKAE